MKFLSLNWQLILSHLVVALLTALALYVFASQAITQAALEQSHNHLEDLGFAASNALEEPFDAYYEGEASLVNIQAAITHWMSEEENLHYTVFLPDGTPIADNLESNPPPANPVSAPEFYLAVMDDVGEGDAIRENEDGEEYIYIAVRIEHDDEVMGILRLGLPYEVATASARRINHLLLLLVFALLLVVGTGGWLLARTLTAPIRALEQSTGQITRGNLQARATPSGPQELRNLAHAFNLMAEQLEEHVKNLRTFVANASHELRSPLTTIKLRAEALQRGALDNPERAHQFLADINLETDRLTRMVNALLDLSRIEAGAGQDTYAPVNLNALMRESCEIFSVRARKLKLQLRTQPMDNAPSILGNEEQLRRVLDNLITNAMVNTPAGGEITLSLTSDGPPGVLRLRIQDTGRGIPPDHLPHIFERFYRVGHTRSDADDEYSTGSGLGLAIVHSIVEAHRGKIRAESIPGKGTTFIIDLPVHLPA